MGQSILIVDDNVITLTLAKRALEGTSYRVLTADSGLKCIEMLKTEKIDLILLDIEMPIMSGIQTLNKIRSNVETLLTPVIFLTAISDRNTVVEAAGLGVVDYIKKPFTPQVLKSRVKKALDEWSFSFDDFDIH